MFWFVSTLLIPPLGLSGYPAVLAPAAVLVCLGPAVTSLLFLNPLPADLTIIRFFCPAIVPSMSSNISSSVPVSSPLSLSSILGELYVGIVGPNDELITAGRLLPL